MGNGSGKEEYGVGTAATTNTGHGFRAEEDERVEQPPASGSAIFKRSTIWNIR